MRSRVKRIDAIVRPERVDAVKEALRHIDHNGVTVMTAQGHGVQGGLRQMWRLKEYVVDLIPKALVMVVVKDYELDDAINAMAMAARTGRMGDGKILVSDVSDVMRIRTGERGIEAL